MKITFQIHIVLPTYRSKCEVDRPFDNNTQHTCIFDWYRGSSNGGQLPQTFQLFVVIVKGINGVHTIK